MPIEIEKKDPKPASTAEASLKTLTDMIGQAVNAAVTKPKEVGPVYKSKYDGVKMDMYFTSPRMLYLLRQAPRAPIAVFNPITGHVEHQFQEDISANIGDGLDEGTETTWVMKGKIAKTHDGKRFRVPGEQVCGFMDLRAWYNAHKAKYQLTDQDLDMMWERMISPKSGFGRDHGTIDMVSNLRWGAEGVVKDGANHTPVANLMGGGNERLGKSL